MKDDQQIEQAAQIMKNKGIVIFPTDTVFGIGCRIDSTDAVNRLYRIKRTSRSQRFPILVSTVQQIQDYAQAPPKAKILMEKYWPGALTIILKSKTGVDKLGFRMPKSDIVKYLIEKVGVPIIGTSANFHKMKTPKSYKELDPKLRKIVDFIIKGECDLKSESTVVDATGSELRIIRQGAVNIET